MKIIFSVTCNPVKKLKVVFEIALEIFDFSTIQFKKFKLIDRQFQNGFNF
jgi:hypothetical protein